MSEYFPSGPSLKDDATEPARPESLPGKVELSIVMPCLNEVETVGRCVRKAMRFLQQSGIAGEVVTGDNGSTDGSQDEAKKEGARVVTVEARGYGSALSGAIRVARGQFIIMGDSDDSYDFTDLMPFVELLRKGNDLVMGTRLRGEIRPRAMPWLHRYVGNPVLTFIANVMYGTRVSDYHCGLRAFTKEAFDRLAIQTTGMEFASEIVIKASLNGMKIVETPIVYSKDGRRNRRPHLRTWRDGWRHLRFLLLFSPRWLFLYPGFVLFVIGLFGGAWIIRSPRSVASVLLDVHTLVICGFACVIGFQLMAFGAFSRVFAAREGFLPIDPKLDWLLRYVHLEEGLLLGAVVLLIGGILFGIAVGQWAQAGFGPLEYQHTMRLVVPAATLLALGTMIVFDSFFLSILGMPRK